MQNIKCPIYISVQKEDFDLTVEQAKLQAMATNVGAVVSFCGLCRDENGRLSALELEHYPGMAEKQIERIAKEAATRFSVKAIRVIHRFGLIKPNEHIVLVMTASSHRNAAFQAADFLMDYMKTDAAFWKREYLVDGTVGEWVEAKDSDTHSQERWQIL